LFTINTLDNSQPNTVWQ